MFLNPAAGQAVIWTDVQYHTYSGFTGYHAYATLYFSRTIITAGVVIETGHIIINIKYAVLGLNARLNDRCIS